MITDKSTQEECQNYLMTKDHEAVEAACIQTGITQIITMDDLRLVAAKLESWETKPENLMAKKDTSEDQLQLIETDHPEAKALKKLVGRYEGLVNDRKAAKERENESRTAVVEKVREIGTPDKNTGAIHVSINGVSISIEPDEKVKIKHQGEDDEGGGEAGGEDEADEAKEPAVQRRGR